MPTTATTSPAGAANAAIGAGELPRRQALLILAGIIAIAAAFRFYGLGWGAPFFHFHIDEHYVFVGADLMRRSMRAAAESDKFFMYSPLPMYLVNALRTGYELVAHPLNLTVPQDQTTYMVLGRAISATFGTATIPVVYAIGTRLSGRVAGLLSAAFLAVTVLHLRDSHFFSVDLSMVFFCALTWLFALRLAERGDLASAVFAGARPRRRGAVQVLGRLHGLADWRRLSAVSAPAGPPIAARRLGTMGRDRGRAARRRRPDVRGAEPALLALFRQVSRRYPHLGDQPAARRLEADLDRAVRRRHLPHALLVHQPHVVGRRSRTGDLGARWIGVARHQAAGARRGQPRRADRVLRRGRTDDRADDSLSAAAHAGAGSGGRRAERGLAAPAASAASWPRWRPCSCSAHRRCTPGPT